MRCVVLDSEGARCINEGDRLFRLHLNSEFYDEIDCVQVPICKEHWEKEFLLAKAVKEESS